MATVITALKYHLHYPEEYLVTILRDGLKPFKGKFLALDGKKKKQKHKKAVGQNSPDFITHLLVKNI